MENDLEMNEINFNLIKNSKAFKKKKKRKDQGSFDFDTVFDDEAEEME